MKEKQTMRKNKTERQMTVSMFAILVLYMSSSITFWSFGQNGWRDDKLAGQFKDSLVGRLHGRMDSLTDECP